MIKIHTGLQHQIIRPNQPNCHPLEDKTIAQALKEVGYATHIVGKWHLGLYKKACWPTHRGFDTFFGLLLGAGDHFTHHHTGGGLPMTPSCTDWTGYDLRENDDLVYGFDGSYGTHIFTQRVQQIIEKHDQQTPLFVYLPYQAPHAPLQAPDSYKEQYNAIKNTKRRIYSAMVTCMDEGIGNITDTLKKVGMWNDTVIIFSTDNGGETSYGGNNWPLRGAKGSQWEGGIHGIGFVSSSLLPDQVKGTIYNGLLHVSDWFPTIVAGIAGGNLNGTQLDGHDVWQAISTGSESPRTEILHNIDPLQPPRTSHDIKGAIRVGDWKLITGLAGDGHWTPVPDSGITPPKPSEPAGKRVWLFNIAEDPNEFHDLSESRPDIVEQLFERLQAYDATAVPPIFPPPDPKADPSLHNNTWTYWEED